MPRRPAKLVAAARRRVARYATLFLIGVLCIAALLTFRTASGTVRFQHRLHHLQSIILRRPNEEHTLKVLVHDAVSRLETAVVDVVVAKKSLVHRIVNGEGRHNGKQILAESGGKRVLTAYVDHEAALAHAFVESLDGFARRLWVDNNPAALRDASVQLHSVAQSIEREVDRLRTQRYIMLKESDVRYAAPAAEAESLVSMLEASRGAAPAMLGGSLPLGDDPVPSGGDAAENGRLRGGNTGRVSTST